MKARMAVVDHTQIFVDTPTESYHSKRLDLSRGVLAAKYRVGTFWLLQRIYRHLLHDRVERNVRPLTEQCLEIRELDCGGVEQGWWPVFTGRLEGVPAPRLATPAPEIDALLKSFGIEAKNARLFLQGKGFGRTRRRVGVVNSWVLPLQVPQRRGAAGRSFCEGEMRA